MLGSRVSALRGLRIGGPNWSFPARVYSDGVPLAPGRTLPTEYLLAQLEARGYRAVSRPAVEPGTYARSGDQFEIALRGFSAAADPRARSHPERVRLRIREGRLAEVERVDASSSDTDRSRDPRLEPVPIAMLSDDRRIWRTWVDLARVPRPVLDAIVAAEDRRFHSHIGLDLRAFLRAFSANMRAGEVREGGSTITQQLARALFLGSERAVMRKLLEVPLALGLELLLSKRQILEMYLNSVYWGQAGGFSLGGIDAAARWYFDLPVESLNVLQGATLAAIIPAPNAYDPFKRPRLVRARRNRVLRSMAEAGRLSAKQAATLAREPLRVRRGRPPGERFPWYTGFVREQLAAVITPRAVAEQGLVVLTAMDLVWQRQAEEGVDQAVSALEDGGPWPWSKPRRTELQAAFIAVEPGTGAVRAMVGGRETVPGGFNRAWQARRQTGSAIKPVVYAAAFTSGRRFTPATTVPDVVRTFQTDQGPWTPKNDDGTYHAEVSLVKALERSLNVATSNLVEAVGPREIARVAARFGLGTLKPVMSIGLGSNEATLLDLTRAFTVFGDSGLLHPPVAIRFVVDPRGRAMSVNSAAKRLERFPPVPRPERELRVLPQPVAALMTGLLTNVVRFGVAYPLRKNYGITRPVAGKTGTTDDYRDAWFVGFSPDIVAGLWLGYDRPRSLNAPSVETALPAWARIVGPMLRGFPPRPFASDAGLEWRYIDPWSGRLAVPGCRTEPVPFLPGTAPTRFCQHAAAFDPLPGDSSYIDSDSVAVPAGASP
ncbi:MAG: transglycosylase domain-containing protein [Candidatus Eisenbacteria bacterium]